MTISQAELRARLGNDVSWDRRLVIEPNLADPQIVDGVSVSIDFHLGNRFAVSHRRRAVKHDPLRPGADYDTAPSEYYVRLGEEFVVHPGQLVLGMTLEWFRFPRDMMAYALVRSRWGRRGLLVATATAVQPGSSGNITLELANVGRIAISVRPGAAVGQLFFHKVLGDIESSSLHTRPGVFAGSRGPVYGEYVQTAQERFLLGLDERT